MQASQHCYLAIVSVLQGINTEHILKTRGLTKHFTISGLLVSNARAAYRTQDCQETGLARRQAGRQAGSTVCMASVRALAHSNMTVLCLHLASLLLPDSAHQHLVGVCFSHAHSCGLGESSTQVTPDESTRTAKQCVYVHLLCVHLVCVYHAGIVSRCQAVDRDW